MKLLPRFLRVRFALCLLTISSALNGCATTQNAKSSHAEAKHLRPQSIRPLTGSYALSDETTTFDSSILQRGAKARGTDFGY